MNCERPFVALGAKVEDADEPAPKPKRSRKTKAAVPLQAVPDEKIVVEPSKPKEWLPRYAGERYLNVWDASIGRWAGKSVTWEEAMELRKHGHVQLKKQE